MVENFLSLKEADIQAREAQSVLNKMNPAFLEKERNAGKKNKINED